MREMVVYTSLNPQSFRDHLLQSRELILIITKTVPKIVRTHRNAHIKPIVNDCKLYGISTWRIAGIIAYFLTVIYRYTSLSSIFLIC